MRILALDVGDKRIGIAVSDPTGTVARALTVIDREKENALGKLKDLLVEYEIKEVIVGLPLETDGRVGNQAQKVRRFAADLRKQGPVAVLEWDERFTTAQAERTLLSFDLRRKKRRSVIDQVSASLILQNYLDHLKIEKHD